MLELRPSCECCDRDLPADATDAFICTFECTWCATCAQAFGYVCPNCGGNLVPRPIRPARLLRENPPRETRVFNPECRERWAAALPPTARPQARLAVRFELFPADLESFVDFYVHVLRFTLAQDRRDEDPPYVYLRRGEVRIGALPAWERVTSAGRAVPHGVEIVLEVDDLIAERDAIIASGHPLEEDIVERPWGLADLRLFDPAGYYLRFTSRAAAG